MWTLTTTKSVTTTGAYAATVPDAAAWSAPLQWFSFDEFEAWHEPGDWVTPEVVDTAHVDAVASEAAIDAVHAMQTCADALEAFNAALSITSVPAGNDHHITADPVVSPITTNGPNSRRGPANTTCWSLGIDVQRHRLAA